MEDENGAFHTRIVFNAAMTTATIVVVGVAFAKAAGEVDGSGSNYYIESVSEETSKGPVRTTINVTLLPTI